MNNMREARNYGLTAEEKAEVKRAEVETKLAKEREARQEKERLEAEEAAERVRNQMEWVRESTFDLVLRFLIGLHNH